MTARSRSGRRPVVGMHDGPKVLQRDGLVGETRTCPRPLSVAQKTRSVVEGPKPRVRPNPPRVAGAPRSRAAPRPRACAPERSRVPARSALSGPPTHPASRAPRESHETQCSYVRRATHQEWHCEVGLEAVELGVLPVDGSLGREVVQGREAERSTGQHLRRDVGPLLLALSSHRGLPHRRGRTSASATGPSRQASWSATAQRDRCRGTRRPAAAPPGSPRPPCPTAG